MNFFILKCLNYILIINKYIMKQQKLKLTPDEMKDACASVTRGDHLKCADNKTALNCPAGTSLAGYIYGPAGEAEWPIGIQCQSGSEIQEIYGPTSGASADNVVDACDGKESGASCYWTDGRNTFSGVCHISNSNVLYCK